MGAVTRTIGSLAVLALTAGPALAQVTQPPPISPTPPAQGMPSTSNQPTAPPPARTPSVLEGPRAAPGLPSPAPPPSGTVAPVPPAVPPTAPPPARTPSVLTPGRSSLPPDGTREVTGVVIQPRAGMLLNPETGTILETRRLTLLGPKSR
jgi:hypothetical protein